MTGLNNSLIQDISTQCAEFEKSPEYTEMIHSAVKKLYADSIREVFQWGDFPKRVKKSLEDAMPQRVEDFVDLAKYNTLLTKQLQELWNENSIPQHVSQQLHEKVMGFIGSFEIPKFIKLSELVEAYIEENEDSACDDRCERPFILREDRESGWWQIGFCDEYKDGYSSFSQKNPDSVYRCDIHLSFTESGLKEKITHEDHKCYGLFSGQLNNGHILGKSPHGFHGTFERLVAALYYGGALLVDDNPDLNASYSWFND